MRTLDCSHCGKAVSSDRIAQKDKNCLHCGIPLAVNKKTSPQLKFILWFIAIVIFCFLMMYLLPFFGSSRHLGR